MELIEVMWGVASFPRNMEMEQARFLNRIGRVDDDLLDCLTQLKIEPANLDKPDDFLLAVNRHDEHHFRLELRREYVAYSHQAAKPEDMDPHIEGFAARLIEQLFIFNQSEEADKGKGPRIDLSTRVKKCIFSFGTKLDCGHTGLRNRQGLTDVLVNGLGDRGLKKFHLNGVLQRVDLKFCLDMSLDLGEREEPWELWVDLQTPGNDDYRYLEAVFLLQTSASRMARPGEAALLLDAYQMVSKIAEPFLVRLTQRG